MNDFILRIKNYLIKLKKQITPYVLLVAEKVKSINIDKDFIIKIGLPCLIVGLGFYSCSFLQRNIKKNINDIFLISDDIRAHFSNKPDYWGLSTSYITKNSIIDKRFIVKDKILLDDGKEILIGKGINGDVVFLRDLSFDIVLKNLNKSQCISYLEAKLSNANQVKLESISVINTNSSTVFTWGDKINSLPVKNYTGKDVCLDENNTIIWSIR